MFTFLLQLRETLQRGHPLHLFTIFVATVWVLWAVKVLLSRRYRPWTAPTALRPAWSSRWWTSRSGCSGRCCAASPSRRRTRPPFADPRMGGVTTRQRILDHDRNLLTRWADWLENSRALYAMPAQSVLGQVGCLPGRTIAFRREILLRSMPAFLGERFLGIFLEISDDRALTNYTLKQGYRTVYQSTSLVYTDAPTRIGKLVRQQYRWARGSQYNTLRMLPWMLRHAPLLAVFFVFDLLLPFLLLGTICGWIYRHLTDSGTNLYQGFLDAYDWHQAVLAIAVLSVTASSLSMAIRHLRHLQERPEDLPRLPLFVLLSTLLLMPIRLYGFLRMAHVGSWGAPASTPTRRCSRPWSPPGPGGDAGMEPPSPYASLLHRRNPWALLPHLLGLLILVGGVLYDN